MKKLMLIVLFACGGSAQSTKDAGSDPEWWSHCKTWKYEKIPYPNNKGYEWFSYCTEWK